MLYQINVKFLCLVFILLSLIFTTNLYANSSTKAPVNIALITPLTGDTALYGLPIKSAVTLATEQINQQGGINGHKINLLIRDSQCDPKLASMIARQLADKKIHFVIGGTCSNSALAILPILRTAHIISISPSATATELTKNKQNQNFFRLIPPDIYQGRFQASFLLKKLKVKSVAILHDKDLYGKSLANIVHNSIKGKVKILTFTGITFGAIDYSVIASKLYHLKPDAVVFEGFIPESRALLIQLYNKNLRMPIILPDTHKAEAYFNFEAKYRQNTYISSPTNLADLESTQGIVQELKKRKHPVSSFGLNAYAIMQIIRQSLLHIKKVSYENLLKYLHQTQYNTIVGKIHFTSSGNLQKNKFIMYKGNGKIFKPVFP